jgi:CheY-like chemotaxis protein
MNRSNQLILYVEDDENDAFLFRHACKKAAIEHEIVVFSDGSSAIDYLSGIGSYADRATHQLPLLLLLDLNMPGVVSGWDVLKWVRNTSSVATLITLILTSSNQAADIRRAYLEGANGYLVKPIDVDERIDMVRAIRDFWIIQNRTIQ